MAGLNAVAFIVLPLRAGEAMLSEKNGWDLTLKATLPLSLGIIGRV